MEDCSESDDYGNALITSLRSVARTAHQLDRHVLTNLAGGAFCPGAEGVDFTQSVDLSGAVPD